MKKMGKTIPIKINFQYDLFDEMFSQDAIDDIVKKLDSGELKLAPAVLYHADGRAELMSIGIVPAFVDIHEDEK